MFRSFLIVSTTCLRTECPIPFLLPLVVGLDRKVPFFLGGISVDLNIRFVLECLGSRSGTECPILSWLSLVVGIDWNVPFFPDCLEWSVSVRKSHNSLIVSGVRSKPEGFFSFPVYQRWTEYHILCLVSQLLSLDKKILSMLFRVNFILFYLFVLFLNQILVSVSLNINFPIVCTVPIRFPLPTRSRDNLWFVLFTMVKPQALTQFQMHDNH